ncbi:glycosyltransferase [Ruminococcaceae bacterium OttesenSCG-928-D13]|nr:glycosyltransferase [Ruminococcaceae bacterium OttesenSCG-928-D13]
MSGGKESATTGRDSLSKIIRRNLSFKRVGILLGRAGRTLKERGWQAMGREFSFRIALAAHGELWKYKTDRPLRRELRFQRENPPSPLRLISVVVPLYNTPEPFLKQMVRSVLRQSYRNFELLLVDGSDAAHAQTSTLAEGYAQKDARVRYLRLEQNLGISGNTNAGLAAAKGDYLTLLDHDDVLQPNALYELAKAVNETGAELIYSDEAVLDETLKHLHEYHFKGGYGPDTLRGCNVITHLCAFTPGLLERSGGGERSEYDGAQDYDLVLRLSEHAGAITHIPKALYFWRRHGGSTAADIGQKPEAVEAGVQAVQAQLDRLGLAGKAEAQKDHPGAVRVRYAVTGQPKVSVLIPNCDHTDDLARCLESLYQKGGWQNLEVLVVENNSKEPATQGYYAEAEKRYPNLRIVRYPGKFNFSDINNFAAKLATGDHLLLLNNDVEILGEHFIPELLGYSQRPDVGAVGAMLYYPIDEVQHAGLIIGLGGTAGVSHKGHPRGNGGDLYRLATTQNMSAVTGAALMVKRSLYLGEGGLDADNFAVAFNDVDFCLRLREKGLWNVFTPFAEGYHYESKSRGYDLSGPNKARFDREAAVFKARWADILEKGDPFYNPHFTLETENFAIG